MTNFIKISAALGMLVFALLAFSTLTSTAFAWGTGDYGSGCCDSDNDGPSYSQSSYYNQGSYYSQSSYHTDAPLPSCVLYAEPTTIARGGTSKLTWTSVNATTVGSIDQGVGSINPQNTAGFRNVSPLVTTKYTMTVKNADGVTRTCDKTVTVTIPTPALTCDYFNVDKAVVDRGESFTLSWGTTNADSVSIDQGVGTVSVDGTYTTSTQADKIFTLTATKGSQTVTCTRPVTIRTSTYSQGSYGGGGGSSSPTCDLDISDDKITKGQQVELSWETSRATEVTIEDEDGDELFSTEDLDDDDKSDFYDGEIKIRPSEDNTYTLIAEKGSKKRTCKVTVDVQGSVVVTEVRNQPLVAGIALTQVPYTGFDAGPTLTLIFYALLGLWALFIAYTLVLKKKVS